MSEEKYATLRIEGAGLSGEGYRVILNGEDISHMVYGVDISMSGDKANEATLHLVSSEMYLDIALDPKNVKLGYAKAFSEGDA